MDQNVVLPNAISIMGVGVVPFDSYTHALDCLQKEIESGGRNFCVAINPEKVYRANRDTRLRSALDQANIGICDGIGVAVAGRILHGRRIKRCTGVDLFLHLMARAAERGWRVFLLGASPESNAGAQERLLQMHPKLRIVGSQDGYFQDAASVIQRINDSGADLLFVAMGSPRQEYWITEHRSAIHAAFCMGVGGTFDVISGKVSRAPKIFRKTGTEFLYRLIREPSRWRRQTVLPLFLLSVLRRRFAGTGNGSGRNTSSSVVNETPVSSFTGDKDVGRTERR